DDLAFEHRAILGNHPPHRSQTSTVASSLPEASQRLSGENASARTRAVWPSRRSRSLAVAVSHTRISGPPARPPTASIRPSGENVSPTGRGGGGAAFLARAL